MIISLIGDDKIVFSTDYPHGDSDFPKAVEEFFEMDGVSKESQKKILWDNCARLYGLTVIGVLGRWRTGVMRLRYQSNYVPLSEIFMPG